MSQKVNILLVDEQPSDRSIHGGVLRDMDQNLIEVDSSREALDRLAKSDIAVVVIVVGARDVDAFGLASSIRGHLRGRDTTIILVSSAPMSDADRIRGYSTGTVDYVSAPIASELLRAKVKVSVERSRKSAELAELNRALEARVAEHTADLEATNARLTASEMRFRLATEAMPGGVYDWDLARSSIVRSPGVVIILGCVPEETDSTLTWWTDRIHPEDLQVREDEIRRALRGGDLTYDVEYRARHRARYWVWVWDRGRIVRDDDSRAVRVVGHITDISAQREAEKRLMEADRRKDAFLATLAHELRNPLAPIRNSVAVMRREAVPEEEMEWCRRVIDRQVSHLTRLVDDLLDLSRITRDKMELRTAEVDLSEIVDSAVEASRPLIEQGALELVVEVPRRPVRLRADRVRVTQCLMNLLNNAAKFTPRGGSIHLRAEVTEARSPEVILKVQDTGMGIEAGKLPRVFDLFYQAESTVDRAHGGLGIGLTLVRRLIELHGGTVDARSDGLGRGSEFIIRLPVAVDSNIVLTPTTRSPFPEETSKSAAPIPRRVLVVDDDRDAAESLTLLLGHVRCDVRTAYGGEEAVALAERFRPEVTFLDIGMPGVTGYDVATRIRATPWGRRVTLVALTGWGQADDRRRTLEAGFDIHLVKPIEPQVLFEILAEAPGAPSRETA